MARSSQKSVQAKELPFGHKLVLTQWIVKQLGHDPLLAHKSGLGHNPMRALADLLNVADRSGLGEQNLHKFYHALRLDWRPQATISLDQLRGYEERIVRHTLAINAKRERPIVWKYYQWLSLLFTEIYLDRYFGDVRALQLSLNAYMAEAKAYWNDQGLALGVSPYSLDELNKVCLQNATGSGKTLLMHVNFLQFRDYAERSTHSHDLTRTVLITPNEALSGQHAREMRESSIRSQRLKLDSGDLLSSGKSGLRQVDFTEVTKLGDEDGDKTMAVRNLGDQNLLLVDEAHRGLGNTKDAEKGWYASRTKLSERGFVFEYSATFKEATTAAKDDAIVEAYAKAVLFDYSYRYFYGDGYGKDYRIFNLPKSQGTADQVYLTAALLSFYQQQRLYDDKRAEFLAYNLEKPLWVFVGSKVLKAGKTETPSDVAKVVEFLAWFLANREDAARTIDMLVDGAADQTGLMDDTGNDIFAGSFLYLGKLGLSGREILADILGRLFGAPGGGELHVSRVKGDPNEVMLRVGQAERPFGLINVGDGSGLTAHLAALGIAGLDVTQSEFAGRYFDDISTGQSPINLLIGSKRFSEGWNSWRVSSLGLMNVGKTEGAQIIQLFGRGVRLKGHDWTLQRSGWSTPTTRPQFIEYLETLNVFGVEADFMQRFRDFLAAEELPSNDSKVVVQVPLSITHDFGQGLQVLRPKKKDKDGQEYTFKKDGAVPTVGDVWTKLAQRQVSIDWYPRIQSISSNVKSQDGQRNEGVFTAAQLTLIDYDKLYFRLEQFKRERGWYNLNIPKGETLTLLARGDWYRIAAPQAVMAQSNFANVQLWQDMALELMQKYLEALYKHCEGAFYEPRLEMRAISRDDANLPTDDHYKLIADANEHQLVQDIESLERKIAASPGGLIEGRELSAYWSKPHLFDPLIYLKKGSKAKVTPLSLNESEFQFVKDLGAYLEANETALLEAGQEVYLLRNESRGKGIGFFEAGNFYPDFILWLKTKERQCVAFIEPHGLINEGEASPKIQFHRTIKEIEKRIDRPAVALESFVTTLTAHGELMWSKSEGTDLKDIVDFNEQNVFFMREQANDYIGMIFDKLNEA